MKRYFLIFLYSVVLFSCRAQAINKQNKETAITIKLPPRSILFLNYITPVPPTHIRFDNPSNHDTALTAYININEITEFFYSDDSIDNNGKAVFNTKYVLAFPGDSIYIGENKKVGYSNNIPYNVDDIINIPSYADIFSSPKRKDNPYHKGLKCLLDTANKTYILNREKITSTKLNSNSKEALNEINLLEKYFQIYNLINAESLNSSEVKIMDSIHNCVLKDSNIFNINSPNVYAIIQNMIKISAKENGAKLDNFWIYFTKASDNIKQFHFYKYYAFFQVMGSFFNNFDGKHSEFSISSLQNISQSLLANKDTDNLKDSLIKFTDILLETKTNYAKAKADLNNFDHGNFAYVFANDAQANHEKKNINKLANVTLDKFDGTKQDLKQIISDKNYKLIVVDFWASWCDPCLRETPLLLKIESRMKNQPIKFIGVSIDTKEDTNKWIATAKAHGLNDEREYRLENYDKSSLTSLLQINTIPRYIVFDNDGNVVDEDLERPSSGKFESMLLKYLQ